MTENRWACIKDRKVQLVIIWDGVSNWEPANQYEMVKLDDNYYAGIGWDYADGKFTDNRPPRENIE